MNKKLFRKELELIINKYSMENGSNTPDFLLADYLMSCLDNFDNIVKSREQWHGIPPSFIRDSKPLEIGTEAGWAKSSTDDTVGFDKEMD